MDHSFLQQAILKANDSVSAGGFPAGAVVVLNDKVVGTGISIGNKIHDCTSHGEMCAIRDACSRLGTSDLRDATLYASMEPCAMCLAAAMWAGISKIVYACDKARVSSDYYGGLYTTEVINNLFAKPIQLVHDATLEADSFAVVQTWERSLSNHVGVSQA